MPEPYLLPAVIEHNRLMAASFSRLLGRPLCAEAGTLAPEALAKFLYEAPFVLLAHTDAPDPVFCYANRRAQELFGYSWEEFTRLPSRLSAEPVSQEGRQRLLDQARRQGYVDNGRGIRIGRDGRSGFPSVSQAPERGSRRRTILGHGAPVSCLLGS